MSVDIAHFTKMVYHWKRFSKVRIRVIFLQFIIVLIESKDYRRILRHICYDPCDFSLRN